MSILTEQAAPTQQDRTDDSAAIAAVLGGVGWPLPTPTSCQPAR